MLKFIATHYCPVRMVNAMNDIKRIGLNIQQIRMLHRFTQSDLAEKCHVAVGTIRNIECGLRNPSLELLLDIADVLHTSVDRLCSAVTPSDSEIWISRISGMIEKYDNAHQLSQAVLETTEMICRHFGTEKNKEGENADVY